jgi:hypothetical protein
MKSYRHIDGHPIPGGSIIAGVLNFSTSTSWKTIKIDRDCKALVAKLRSGDEWRCKRVGENAYYTVSDMISIDIALKAGENLFQVLSPSGNDTLEVMLLD